MANELGGYTNYEQIGSGSERAFIAQKVFNDAVHVIIGIGYKPLLFATQVVNGVNYKFIALGTLVTPEPSNALYSIVVHVSLDGKAEKPDIQKLDV
jgi:hypothetical protein